MKVTCPNFFYNLNGLWRQQGTEDHQRTHNKVLFIISCAGNHSFRCQLCSTIMVCSEGRSLYSFCLQPIADGVCSRLGSIDIGWHCVPWNVSHVHPASHYNSINSKLIAVYCTALYNHLDLEFSVHEVQDAHTEYLILYT